VIPYRQRADCRAKTARFTPDFHGFSAIAPIIAPKRRDRGVFAFFIAKSKFTRKDAKAQRISSAAVFFASLRVRDFAFNQMQSNAKG